MQFCCACELVSPQSISISPLSRAPLGGWSSGGLKARLPAWARYSAVALLAGQITLGLLLLQSVLQVEQLLREEGGRGGEQVELVGLVDWVE